MENGVSFHSVDGIELKGTLREVQAGETSCIVLCHGLTATREEDGVFTCLAEMLSASGLPSFRFDFRGHGESGGRQEEMTVAGEALDLAASLDFLCARGYRRFGVVAASFAGGAASLTVPGRKEVEALVLWNAVVNFTPLFSMMDIVARVFWGDMEKAVRDRGYAEVGPGKFRMGRAVFGEMKTLNPGGLLAGLKLPVLLVHGDRDVLVPPADSLALAGRIPGAVMEIVPGAGHGFHEAVHMEAACRKAAVFLAGRLSPAKIR